jgi:hypothetical protein
VISKDPAHAALASEADFIAAQDTAAPRGLAGPAVRRHLLAGLLECGRCGRRLESAWSNGKPAYRVPPRPGTRSSIARTTIIEPGGCDPHLDNLASQAQAAQLTDPAAWRHSSSTRLVRMMRSSRVQQTCA